ncbi:peptidoglycan-binding domain-containing protein [Devosia sp. FKR38]|uniref:peptidoglycan-binding domain-containing protein n=1 Tax=Devosia sp. FKR38 TaxID=2562312 RepID=UPI001484DD57|nr:peptidoglycan-binding domain-containing protein [Devosia sp. FKR38]
MTANTLSHLPLAAGSALASALGRSGRWALSHYMRAPLASTGLMALVTLTALAGSNALYFQTKRHPAPFFAPVQAMPVAEIPQVVQPNTGVLPVIPAQRVVAPTQVVTNETTGSVAPPAIPDAPVGNAQAFAVQKKLAELGLFAGTVDGFYGPMTANAIRAFEQRNGLEPTGAMTPAVVDAILQSDAAGRMPVVQPVAQPVAVAPQPAPVVVPPQPARQAQIAPQPQPMVQSAQALTPVDNAVDVVGNAAETTIDSIVAAFESGDSSAATPLAPRTALPALSSQRSPTASVPAAEPVPPVQVADITPQTVAPQQTAAPALDPANNVELVSQIQRGLASLGFYHGAIDGHPGDSTARAIREFENFNSYKLTGEVKPDLVGLLRNAGATL